MSILCRKTERTLSFTMNAKHLDSLLCFFVFKMFGEGMLHRISAKWMPSSTEQLGCAIPYIPTGVLTLFFELKQLIGCCHIPNSVYAKSMQIRLNSPHLPLTANEKGGGESGLCTGCIINPTEGILRMLPYFAVVCSILHVFLHNLVNIPSICKRNIST